MALIEPHYPEAEGGRPAYPLMTILRVHLIQNWFGYSDPAMEEALDETTILRQFAGLSLERIPDSVSVDCWRRMSWRPAFLVSSMATWATVACHCARSPHPDLPICSYE